MTGLLTCSHGGQSNPPASAAAGVTTAPASPDIDPLWTTSGAVPGTEEPVRAMTVVIVVLAVMARALLRHRVWAQGA